jgi:hypothetical protein
LIGLETTTGCKLQHAKEGRAGGDRMIPLLARLAGPPFSLYKHALSVFALRENMHGTTIRQLRYELAELHPLFRVIKIEILLKCIARGDIHDARDAFSEIYAGIGEQTPRQILAYEAVCMILSMPRENLLQIVRSEIQAMLPRGPGNVRRVVEILDQCSTDELQEIHMHLGTLLYD